MDCCFPQIQKVQGSVSLVQHHEDLRIYNDLLCNSLNEQPVIGAISSRPEDHDDDLDEKDHRENAECPGVAPGIVFFNQNRQAVKNAHDQEGDKPAIHPSVVQADVDIPGGIGDANVTDPGDDPGYGREKDQQLCAILAEKHRQPYKEQDEANPRNGQRNAENLLRYPV